MKPASSSGRLAHKTEAMRALHRMTFAGTVPLLAKISVAAKIIADWAERSHQPKNHANDEQFVAPRAPLRFVFTTEQTGSLRLGFNH